jgi:hypothetical protein
MAEPDCLCTTSHLARHPLPLWDATYKIEKKRHKRCAEVLVCRSNAGPAVQLPHTLPASMPARLTHPCCQPVPSASGPPPHVIQLHVNSIPAQGLVVRPFAKACSSLNENPKGQYQARLGAGFQPDTAHDPCHIAHMAAHIQSMQEHLSPTHKHSRWHDILHCNEHAGLYREILRARAC